MSRQTGIVPRFSFQSALASFIFVIAVAGIAFVAGRVTSPHTIQSINNQSSAPQVQEDQKINKTFNFSVKNDKGVEITKIAYTIEDAALQNQIIIRGAQANAIKGKTFLIINFNLNNTSKNYIQLNSRDYVRLIGQNGELIAPDIHNDPIQVQPISTKQSRLGFPVDATVKKFTLSVGELDGKRTQIPVNF